MRRMFAVSAFGEWCLFLYAHRRGFHGDAAAADTEVRRCFYNKKTDGKIGIFSFRVEI